MTEFNGYHLDLKFEIPDNKPFEGNTGYTKEDISLVFVIGGNVENNTADAVLTVYKDNTAALCDLNNGIFYSNSEKFIKHLKDQYSSQE